MRRARCSDAWRKIARARARRALAGVLRLCTRLLLEVQAARDEQIADDLRRHECPTAHRRGGVHVPRGLDTAPHGMAWHGMAWHAGLHAPTSMCQGDSAPSQCGPWGSQVDQSLPWPWRGRGASANRAGYHAARWAWLCVCLCAFVCVCVRERERERVCVCVCVRVRVYACARGERGVGGECRQYDPGHSAAAQVVAAGAAAHARAALRGLLLVHFAVASAARRVAAAHVALVKAAARKRNAAATRAVRMPRGVPRGTGRTAALPGSERPLHVRAPPLSPCVRARVHA